MRLRSRSLSSTTVDPKSRHQAYDQPADHYRILTAIPPSERRTYAPPTDPGLTYKPTLRRYASQMYLRLNLGTPLLSGSYFSTLYLLLLPPSSTFFVKTSSLCRILPTYILTVLHTYHNPTPVPLTNPGLVLQLTLLLATSPI